jgi:hypothetical protein
MTPPVAIFAFLMSPFVLFAIVGGIPMAWDRACRKVGHPPLTLEEERLLSRCLQMIWVGLIVGLMAGFWLGAWHVEWRATHPAL